MKHISKLIIALSAIAALSVSCKKEYPEYEWAEKEAGYGVYFAQGTKTSYTFTEDGSFTVPVYRTVTDGAFSVPVTYTGDTDAFTLPASVSFASGSNKAELVVAYDFENAEAGKNFTVNVKLASNTTVYGTSEISFTAGKPSAWIYFTDDEDKKIKITWTQGWWEETHVGYIKYTEDGDLRYCQTETLPQTVDGEVYEGFWGTGKDVEMNFIWDTKTNYIYYEPQFVYMNSTYGAPVYMHDDYGYYNYISEKYTGAWTDALDFWTRNPAEDTSTVSYYDGNGGFYFYVDCFWMYGIGGWDVLGHDTVGICEGFVRTVDYNELDYTDLFVGNVESGFFDDEWSDQLFSIASNDSTVYFMPNYFSEGYGLAFGVEYGEDDLAGELSSSMKITNVENEQNTGVKTFGQDTFVTIKKGSIAIDEETELPVITLVLDVYTKKFENEEDEVGTVDHKFGQFTEKFTVTGTAGYSANDITGLAKTAYSSYKWLTTAMVQVDAAGTIDRAEIGYSYFTDLGADEDGYEYLSVNHLSGVKDDFWETGDDVVCEWYGGCLYLDTQDISDFVYDGKNYPTQALLYSSKTGYGYKPGYFYLLGGYVKEDGVLAFVDYPENEVKIDGLFFYADEFGGLEYPYNYVLELAGSVETTSIMKSSSAVRKTRKAYSPSATAVKSGKNALNISSSEPAVAVQSVSAPRHFNYEGGVKGTRNFEKPASRSTSRARRNLR